MWKHEWKYMKGNVIVTVQALDENEDKQTFEFSCFVSEEVGDYDRLDYLSYVAHYMALLRNYYHAELIDVKEQRNDRAL